MPSFEQGDVIKVPFPYTDRPVRQFRPALVISTGGIEDRHGLLWVTMITSARNRGWAEDVPVENLSRAGLPAASVIRAAKVATIETGDATKLGRVTGTALQQVLAAIGREMGLRSTRR